MIGIWVGTCLAVLLVSLAGIPLNSSHGGVTPVPGLAIVAPFHGHSHWVAKSFSGTCATHHIIDPLQFHKFAGIETVALNTSANGGACYASTGGTTTASSHIILEKTFSLRKFAGISGIHKMVATWNVSGFISTTSRGSISSYADAYVWVGWFTVCDVTNGTTNATCTTACTRGFGGYPCSIAAWSWSPANSSKNLTFNQSAKAYVNMTLNSTHTYIAVVSLRYYLDAVAFGKGSRSQATLWLAPPFGGAKLSSISFY
jgi:hypothetical protein